MKAFSPWETKKAWVLSFAHYLAARTVILIQRKDPRNPKKDLPFDSTGPGNGSGTYIEAKGRTFVATAKHVARGFSVETGFATVPSLRPGLATEVKCPIIAVHPHPTLDVSLIEVNSEVPRRTGYSAVPLAEIVPHYKEVSGHSLMWAGYPKDLRSPANNEIQHLGFHFAVTRPILSPTRRRQALEAAIDSDDPFNAHYDFFSLRLPTGFDLETGKKEVLGFTLPGLSGGGIWKLPPRPTRHELIDPTKIRLIGVQCSTVPMPGKAKEQWVRAIRCQAIADILNGLIAIGDT